MENIKSFKNLFGSYVMDKMIQSADEKRKDAKAHDREVRMFETIDDYIEQA